jgi:predicted HTH transcriptional regulator
MALHVNIENLIKGEVVETGRIEYKSGWNPERVIHSMCAFVNDINNLGGGYIVIGVEEKDGILQLTTVGLQKNQLDAMKRNGSPEPRFETDHERSYFLAVLPVHPDVTALSRKDNSIFEAGKSSRVLDKLGTRLSQVCPKCWCGCHTAEPL